MIATTHAATPIAASRDLTTRIYVEESPGASLAWQVPRDPDLRRRSVKAPSRCCLSPDAVVSAAAPRTPAWDELQSSAGARSTSPSLLHLWRAAVSPSLSPSMHTSSDLGRASLSDVAPADHASIRGSGARSAGRRRVPSGCGAGGSCAARRTFVPPPSTRGRVPSRGRCSGGRSPVSRLGGTARDGTCRGHRRDRRSQSENCDLVAERQGQPTCGAAPPRRQDRHGHHQKADDPRHLP
jgi:hypothetical protein